MNTKYAELNESNLKITQPTPGVTAEFDPANSLDEAIQRGRLEIVTAALIVAVDAALRCGDTSSLELDAKIAEVNNDLARQGLPSAQIGPSHYESHNVRGLYRLSSRFTKALRHGEGRYTVGGLGTPGGGTNLLGDKAVSLGFDYDSPQGTSINDSHWYKKTFQMVASGPNMITMGLHNNAGQFIREDTMRAELEDPQLIPFLGGDPRVRISDTQPNTIKELAHRAYSYGHDQAPANGFRFAAVSEYLSALATSGFVYHAKGPNEPSKYRASVNAHLIDPTSDIGLAIRLAGTPVNYDREIRFSEDSESAGDFAVTYSDGSAVELGSLSLDVSPITRIASHDKSHWASMRQDENVLQRSDRREAAERLSSVTEGIRERLLNG